ncbi:MAG: NADH-quinone oxidoreductase subunit N [Thermodesulforhabdaceae bacterium]
MANFDMLSISPDLVLIAFALLFLLMGAFSRTPKVHKYDMLSIIAFSLAILLNLFIFGSKRFGFYDMMLYDDLAGIFRFIFYGIGILVSLMSDPYIEGKVRHKGEYYALIVLSVVGMSFIATSYDLIMLVLGVEAMSLSVYILAGMFKHDEASAEASIKYFLLGAFSTAIMLLGIAFIYGTVGTTNYNLIIENYNKYLHSGLQVGIFMLGVSAVLAGVLFKIAAVPFHMWTPDVYEGAPTSVTAFMISGVKAASFFMLLRVFLVALKVTVFNLVGIMVFISIITMTLGNIAALTQKSIKRMLAYSSIAHAGYMLIGFVALNKTGLAAIVFYLIAYALMNIGAFAVLVLLEEKGKNLENVSGCGFLYPFLGLMMTIFMFSMVGLPPTGGFMGKFYIFKGALEAGYLWLVIIAVLNSAISAYFYLRVLVYMFFEKPLDTGGVLQASSPAVTTALVITSLGVLVLGIFPQYFFELTTKYMTYLP